MLNPGLTKNVGDKSRLGSDGNNGIQGLNVSNSAVGEASGSKDVNMQNLNNYGKPMLFSNVV